MTSMTMPVEAIPADAPGVCPVCGGRTLAPEGASSALLAVCDVLVFKTLETMGKKIVREERHRYRVLGTRPWHEAHTLWQVPESTIARSLKRAWDVVPALLDTHGCCGVTSRQVTAMLDSYVHDIVLEGRHHDIADLADRFERDLGLPVYLHSRKRGHRHG